MKPQQHVLNRSLSTSSTSVSEHGKRTKPSAIWHVCSIDNGCCVVSSICRSRTQYPSCPSYEQFREGAQVSVLQTQLPRTKDKKE